MALELSVSHNGDNLKTFAENIESSGDKQDVSALLSALQKIKEQSNSFITTLVEQDKAHGTDAVSILQTKRKCADEGMCVIHSTDKACCTNC